MEKAKIKCILAPVKDVRKVLFYGHKPEKISLIYMRNYMRFLGILPGSWQNESLYYNLINKFVMLMLVKLSLSITFDLYEVSQDIVQFGDDLVVLIGIYLIFFKIIHCAYYSQDIVDIISEFNRMHLYFKNLKESRNLSKILKVQRLFYLAELISFFHYAVLCFLFTLAICLPPILTSNGTPYRAKYPFNWESFEEHPILFSSVYIFQCIMTQFMLISIVVIDNVGCHLFTQTTLNLKLLCIRIRELGSKSEEQNLKELQELIKFHQYMINLITKINDIYYYNYASQMAASTFMICLTAFEAMLAQDQPMIAIKFQIYMFSAFAQLFYWCLTGNMVYYNSLDVADAAYEIDRWYDQSKEFKYCLRFLIKRAQNPLVFRPKPFFCFNFESFTSILSSSYSYFALLRTMND